MKVEAFECPRIIRLQSQGGIMLLLALALCLLGCPAPRPGDPNLKSSAPERATANISSATPPTTTSDLSSVATNVASTPFDSERAFSHVREMVAFGARPAGSAELRRTREFIVRELNSYGLQVTLDEFEARTPVGTRRMVNITAELPGASSDFIMIGSHYDTKFYKNMRFVGANDGASSTAVVMELARILAADSRAGARPALTRRFVFFDGEEAFCDDWSDCKNPDASGKQTLPDNTYGSRHYADKLAKQGELASARALVLLDLVGYRDLRFERDTYSTAWLTDVIWETARELGYGNVFVASEDAIEDDHLPFLTKGVNAVDIIQLGTYPHWHTAEDTLDKIAPASLKITGDVVLASLPKIEKRLVAREGS